MKIKLSLLLICILGFYANGMEEKIRTLASESVIFQHLYTFQNFENEKVFVAFEFLNQLIEKNVEASDVYIYVKYSSTDVSNDQFISIVSNDELAETIDLKRYYESVPDLQAKDIIQITLYSEKLNVREFIQSVEYALLNRLEFKARLQESYEITKRNILNLNDLENITIDDHLSSTKDIVTEFDPVVVFDSSDIRPYQLFGTVDNFYLVSTSKDTLSQFNDAYQISQVDSSNLLIFTGYNYVTHLNLDEPTHLRELDIPLGGFKSREPFVVSSIDNGFQISFEASNQAILAFRCDCEAKRFPDKIDLEYTFYSNEPTIVDSISPCVD